MHCDGAGAWLYKSFKWNLKSLKNVTSNILSFSNQLRNNNLISKWSRRFHYLLILIAQQDHHHHSFITFTINHTVPLPWLIVNNVIALSCPAENTRTATAAEAPDCAMTEVNQIFCISLSPPSQTRPTIISLFISCCNTRSHQLLAPRAATDWPTALFVLCCLGQEIHSIPTRCDTRSPFNIMLVHCAYVHLKLFLGSGM